MSNTSLSLVFVAWMVANFIAYGVLLLSDRAGWVRAAKAFCRLSQWLLAAVFLVIFAEVWWQESLLTFSAVPTSVLTVPIQDHGVKYVSPHDAKIISFCGTLFDLMLLPFFASVIGGMGLKSVNEASVEKRRRNVSQ